MRAHPVIAIAPIAAADVTKSVSKPRSSTVDQMTSASYRALSQRDGAVIDVVA